MTLFAFILSVLMGVGSLAFAYHQGEQVLFARGLLILGALWYLAAWRRWRWFSSIGILVLVALSGYGLWIELSPGWMIAGALGGLMAWDLDEFRYRLSSAAKDDDRSGLERRHLARLTLMVVIALFVSSLAMLVRLEFTFEWSLVLVLVAALGLTQLVAWLRKGGS